MAHRPILFTAHTAHAQTPTAANASVLTSVTREASGTLTKYRFVEIVNGNEYKVSTCNADTDTPFGIVQAEYTNGSACTVARTGTVWAETGAAVALGDLLKIDSSGRVVPIGALPTQARIVGQAATAASGSGGYVLLDFMPGVAYGATLAVPATTDCTTNTSVTAVTGTLYTNLGTSAVVTLALPAAATANTTYSFAVKAGYALRIDPGANDAFYIAGAKQADGKYLELTGIGATATIVADAAGDWTVWQRVGRAMIESAPTFTTIDDALSVIDSTTNYDIPASLGAGASERVLTNLGAAGTITVILPAAPSVGTRFTVYCRTAQAIRVDPGASDGVIINGALQADGKYIEFDAVGEWLEIIAGTDANWMGRGSGTFTVES